MEKQKLKIPRDLPIIPEVAMKVINLAGEGMDMSFRELENTIKVDPGLTSKILKVANSALYARQKEILKLQTAITLLGFNNIKSLVLLLTASSLFQKVKNTDFYKTFWNHSIISAFLAKNLAKKTEKNEIAENVFICTLLHKIGQVLIFTSNQEEYMILLEKEVSQDTWIEELEEEAFGTNHRKIAAELFTKWNFPDMFKEVAEEQNSMNITSSNKSIIVLVTIASLLTTKLGYGNFTSPKEKLLSKVLLHTNLTEDDLNYYTANYKQILEKDTLYEECKNLLGIG